jgi:hypothetical protein
MTLAEYCLQLDIPDDVYADETFTKARLAICDMIGLSNVRFTLDELQPKSLIFGVYPVS